MLDYICTTTQEALIAICLFFAIFFILFFVLRLAIIFLSLLDPEEMADPDENINIFFTEKLPPSVAIARKKNAKRNN